MDLMIRFTSLDYEDFLVYQDALDEEMVFLVKDEVIFRSYDEREFINYVNNYLEEMLNEFNWCFN